MPTHREFDEFRMWIASGPEMSTIEDIAGALRRTAQKLLAGYDGNGTVDSEYDNAVGQYEVLRPGWKKGIPARHRRRDLRR